MVDFPYYFVFVKNKLNANIFTAAIFQYDCQLYFYVLSIVKPKHVFKTFYSTIFKYDIFTCQLFVSLVNNEKKP